MLNNAFYGITLENVRNRKNIIITSDGEKFKLKASKITYDTSEDFGNNVIAIHKKNNKILFDKFNYIGFTILEYSKLIMYKFIYDVLEKNIPNQYKIHAGDTDSIFVEFSINPTETYQDLINKINHEILQRWNPCGSNTDLKYFFLNYRK